ncbi:MAG: hypothetical protein WDN30_15615 [Pararobbsia sp.]
MSGTRARRGLGGGGTPRGRAGGGPGNSRADRRAVAIPSLPAFAKLIAPAAPVATASAPTAASRAELARSLDAVISTLDSDKQRTALVTQLEKLRDAQRAVDASQPAPPPASAGLLGAIATGLTEVQTNVRVGRSPFHYWQTRAHEAGRELAGIFTAAPARRSRNSYSISSRCSRSGA